MSVSAQQRGFTECIYSLLQNISTTTFLAGELPATVAALREYCLQNSERNVGEIPPIDQQSEICNET